MSTLFDRSPEELAEKKDPKERFIQALDENAIEGLFRDFLERYCADKWIDIFQGTTILEDALKLSGRKETTGEQVCSFCQFLYKRKQLLEFQSIYQQSPYESFEMSYKERLFKEVALNFFPEDPIGFHNCFPGDSFSATIGEFVVHFAPFYYGHGICFDDAFRKTLSVDQFWGLFEALFYIDFQQKEARYSFSSLSETDPYEGFCASDWSKFCDLPSVSLLKEYLVNLTTSSSQDVSFSWLNTLPDRLARQIDILDFRLRECATQEKISEEGRYTYLIQHLFKKLQNELNSIWCVNSNPIGMSDNVKNRFGEMYHEKYLPLVPDQPIDRIKSIIEWSLERDLQKWGTAESLIVISNTLDFNLWLISPYKEIWKSEFDKVVDSLPPEPKLAILSKSFPVGTLLYPSRVPSNIVIPEPVHIAGTGETERYSYKFPDEYIQSHNDLFKSTLSGSEVTSELFVDTIINSISVGDTDEDFIPLIDKCLGIIRGLLISGKVNYEDSSIKRLLDLLKFQAPDKAARHWLMLLRFAQNPSCDTNLASENLGVVYLPVEEFVGIHIPHTHVSPKGMSANEHNEYTIKVYLERLQWIAEFCLDRLQLRKKEKAGPDGYTNEQMKEQSSHWRKAYLKALSEMNTDLGGRIHKMAHFIRKNDPDEDVRTIASQCYKASRRNRSHPQNKNEIKRSISAAYWWMLLAQRKELGLEVDDDAALKTRRRLLR